MPTFKNSPSGKRQPKTLRPASIAEAQERDFLDEIARLTQQQQRSISGIAITVHAMKSTLSVLEGYLQLLESQRLGPLTEKQSHCLQDMLATGEQLQETISELLTYSFWASKTRKPQLGNGDLAACVERIYREWTPPYAAKGVDLQFEVRGAIRLFPFETAGVERMVTCLLDNALKFTPRGKPVLLTVEPYFWERRSARQMPVLERRKNGRSDANAALVSVLDAGPGILPEDQQEIFEEFYSAAAGGVKPGTGLGLAIARYVAQMHGGKIWVESSVGKGSRFCVVLPF